MGMGEEGLEQRLVEFSLLRVNLVGYKVISPARV